MAIEFDGKGNIVGTTPDGVIAVKFYSLEKQIAELKSQLQQKDTIINEFMEELKWQRKVSLSSNEAFAVSRIDILINCLQELKGDDK